MPSLSDRWFALVMSAIGGPYDALLAEHKRALLGGLRGRVVEIGPGEGANLKYYARGVCWTGFEPNVCLHPAIRREAEALGMTIDLRRHRAESLPVDAGSADAVVSTSVLCSVRDLRRTLAEARRVLRPGGRLVFVEHVVAGPGSMLRVGQHAIAPVWKCCAGGCNPDRDTLAAIERAGFERVEARHFKLPLGPVAPHVAGYAVR